MSLSHEPGRLADREDACRIDVWLWRARFCKTRGIAAALVERGAVRLDKPSRCVHPGDALTFVQNGRVTSLQVEALGERRGPAEEARALYSLLTA